MQVRHLTDPSETDYDEVVYDNKVAVVSWGKGYSADILVTRVTTRAEAQQIIAALNAASDVLI